MSRILGIDYGLTKIGLALGIGSIVEPYKVLPNILNHKVAEDSLKEIVNLIENEGIRTVVIGIPHNKKGEEVGHSDLIRKFSEELKSRIDNKVFIEFIDESMTSKESVDVAIDAGISQKRRKTDDAIAAGLIIKRWWEENGVGNNTTS